MKKLLFSLLAGLGLLASTVVTAAAQAAPTADAGLLQNIQRRLTWRTPPDSVAQLAAALESLRQRRPNPYVSYWAAFAQYHLFFRVEKDERRAEAALKQGIEQLEAVPTKTAEHYALLSLLQGLNLRFASFITMPFKANTVKETAEKALALDPRNPRAHYARGISDYYTPAQYGGGKVAAEHFRQTLALPEKADPNPYAPDWGRADAYWYLAQTLQKAGQAAEARRVAVQGLATYPDNSRLKSLVAKL